MNYINISNESYPPTLPANTVMNTIKITSIIVHIKKNIISIAYEIGKTDLINPKKYGAYYNNVVEYPFTMTTTTTTELTVPATVPPTTTTTTTIEYLFTTTNTITTTTTDTLTEPPTFVPTTTTTTTTFFDIDAYKTFVNTNLSFIAASS